MAFRITPNLGPDVEQTGPGYWDMISEKVTDATFVPSYQPGVRVVGSDGHSYVWVKAGAAFAAGAAVQINETTWVATAGGTAWTAPVAVANGAWFHARSVALA